MSATFGLNSFPSQKKKQVLHIATRFLHGGSEKDLVEAIQSLPEDEYESCLLVGAEHNAALIQKMVPGGCRVEVEPHLVREVSPAHDVRAGASISRFIRRNRFDIVHTCQSKAGILGRMAASVAGTPVILHSLSMANFFERGSASASRAYKGAERIAARWTDAYFVVGTDLMQRYLRAGIADAGRFHVVRSPINLSDFQRAGDMQKGLARRLLGLPAEGPLIAYVGSLEERKGVRRLAFYLAALRGLCQDAPHLVIAGEGPLEREVRADFAARGLSDSVTFLGFTSEVPTVMRATDCLVLLSDAEGLPQVLVQAAAARRPFVAFPVDGANELVWRGATGTVVSESDPAAAARSTLQYLSSGDVKPIDMREWSSSAVRTAYREVFDSQAGGLAEANGLRLLRHGARPRRSIPA